MADRGFSFVASTSDDVVAYRVTLSKDGSAVGSKDYPDAEIVDPADSSKRRIDLADDSSFPNLDGVYAVEVLAVDDAGNTSSPLLGSLSLDFVAPDAPTGFEAF